jgi:hypothetical protein
VTRPNDQELARRRDIAAGLWLDNYPIREISAALGISETALDADLRSRGLKGRRRELVNDRLPKIAWRDSEVAPLSHPGVYLRSHTLMVIENLTTHLERENAENCLAFDVHDATRHGDELWLSQARAKLARHIDYLLRLQAVLDSPEARERGLAAVMNPTVKPLLKAVE